MITPYLRKFNTEGGTLYVFPSVSKDLTKTFVSNDYEFKFSHFACLNIPDIYKGGYTSEKDKGLYIKTLMGNKTVTWNDEGMGKAITENLQNYVMNFETAILNGMGDNDDYDPDVLTTVSEKVFWNWMQKVGAIKFNESGTAEDSSDIIRRTVQYIGNIDVMNTVEIGGDTFEELYIHIPSTVGASTSVYFRTGDKTDEKNYLNTEYEIINKINGIDHSEYIQGRTVEDSSPYELNIEAFYDTDAGSNIYIGDIGHTIDFRDSSYDSGIGINNMNSKSLEDFEFNAILIYYDIYEKTNNPGVKRIATNLYGILFLEKVTDNGTNAISDDSSQGYIQRYPKKKETVYGNGNSYALKLDLKVSTFGDAENTSYDIRPSDEDKIESMSLYMRALEQLQKCIDIFYTQKQQIVNLSERVAFLENLVVGIDTISSLKKNIEDLYNRCNGNSVVDTATLLGLIDNNSKRLDNIIHGGKDVKLQFDTDVIQAGAGIGIEKSSNKVIINSEQRYSINTVYDKISDEIISESNPIDLTTNNKEYRIPLMAGNNLAMIYIDSSNNSDENLEIYIDEETNNYRWEVGQSLKLLFMSSLMFSDPNKGIIIYPTTDKTITIQYSDFEGNDLIEIICVGENEFIYLIK